MRIEIEDAGRGILVLTLTASRGRPKLLKSDIATTSLLRVTTSCSPLFTQLSACL
jgi:hypothetical protein